MTIIYALKDNLSEGYLTKADTLQPLSTTTRTFQKQERAYKVANNINTYMWMLVKELTHGQRYARVNISSPEFNKQLYDRYNTRRLTVIPVTIEELLTTYSLNRGSSPFSP